MARQILGKVKVTPKGAYKSGTNYEVLDIVTYNGGSFIARSNTSANPTNKTYWQVIAEKGDDYVMTEEDFQAIVREITEDAESIFNQNARSKTEDFNNNATSKKNDFNSNATSKTSAYNSNADEKVGAYNSNATSKLNAYNTNDTAKTKTYNDNAKTLLDAYNNNASSVVTGFNDNAIAKLNEYNRNADTKVANLEERTSELNEMLEEEGIIQRDLIRDEGESYDRRITANSNEIYRIKDDILETGEASGSYVTLKDSTMAEYQELEVDGVCNQETTTGKNFFNAKDIVIKENLSLDKSDYFTVEYDNSNGTSTKYIQVYPSKNLNLKTSTSYSIITEVKAVSGQGILYSSSMFQSTGGQITSSINYNFNSLNNGIVKKSIGTTRASFNNVVEGIRTFVQFNAGEKGSITFRISLLEDTSILPDNFVYEPYTGGQASPNPSYPQPISVVENSIDVVSSNKNLSNGINQNLWLNGNASSYGTASNNSGLCIELDGVSNYTISSNVVQERYRIGMTMVNPLEVTSGFTKRGYAMDNTSDSRTISSTEYKYLIVNATDLSNIMIERNSSATQFEKHLESKINVNLRDEFIAKINDTCKDTLSVEYNFDDGEYHLILNKMVGKYEMNDFSGVNTNSFDIKNVQYLTPTINDVEPNTLKPIYSNYFSEFASTSNTKKIRFNIPYIFLPGISKTSTTTEAKNKFVEIMANKEIYFYYPLETPYEVDLGVVDMPITYNEVTNLYTNSDLLPIITAKYYRTFEKTIKNLQVDTVGLQAQLRSLEERYQAILTALPNPTSEIESEVE